MGYKYHMNKYKPNYKFFRRKKFQTIGFFILGIGIGVILSFVILEYTIFIGIGCCCVGIFLISK